MSDRIEKHTELFAPPGCPVHWELDVDAYLKVGDDLLREAVLQLEQPARGHNKWMLVQRIKDYLPEE